MIRDGAARGLITSDFATRLLSNSYTLREAAGRIMTHLNSQLPYAYVHLVSLTVHVYVFILATWFG